MTQQKARKQRVRARMSKTGERYTTARSQVLAKESSRSAPEPAAANGHQSDETSLAMTSEVATGARPETVEATSTPVPDSPFRGGYHASDDALVRRTGNTWEHWYRLLDGWGAAGRPHPEIARWLNVEQGVDGWWSQELTVRYEMAIGRRQPGQRPDGFEATASKTVNVPVERLYAAIAEDDQRSRWLTRPLRLRMAKPCKSVRFDWDDGPQRIVFWCEAQGERSTVSLAHQRMPDRETADAMKSFWRERMKALQAFLEGPG